MDRNFKLRQMFSDYLELKSRGSTATPPAFPPPDMLLSSLSEEDKKRALCKKITEEEAEVFDFPENARPVVVFEPSYELKWYNKIDPATQAPRLNSEEETVKLSQRLLQLFLKTEMLESAAVHKYDDVRAIRVFFMDDREVPTERLVAILDNVFTVAMTKLGQFSDKISVVVDYELRAFMSDPMKAKRLILETMLKFPEYIPDAWGGEAAIMKWKEAKEADVRRREADEKDREKEMAAESERKEKEKEEAKKKEERIKKEVEEAERKKKEEKEKRRKEAQEQKRKEEKRKKEEKKKEDEKKEEKKEKEKKRTKRGKKTGATTDASKTREQSRENTLEVLPNSPGTPTVATPPPVKKAAKKNLSKETTVEMKTAAAAHGAGPHGAGPHGGPHGPHGFGGAAKRLFLTPGRKAKKNT